jgi:PAS domain S-box-containing protein
MSSAHLPATDFRERGRLAALLGVAMLAVLALLAYLIWSGHEEAIRAAETTTRNYAAILEARLDATLRRIDADLLEQAGSLPDAALSGRAVPRYARELNAGLDTHLVNFAELGGLRVFDANGASLYAADAPTARLANIADRGYFQLLRDNPRTGLVFSEAVISRPRGQHRMIAARALRDERGGFRGVVAAAIDLEHFQKLFQSLDLGERGLVAIRRSDDFTQVVRWPPLDSEAGKALPPDNPMRAAISGGQTRATAEYAASSDGVVRIFSVHKLERFPFYVVAALARGNVLAGWRARSLAVGGASLLLLGLLGALLLRLRRSEARQVQALTELTGSEANLRAMSDNASVGALVILEGHYAFANRHVARMLGYSVEELGQIPIADVIHPEYRTLLLERHRQRLASEDVPVSYEALMLAKNGSAIPVEVNAAVTRWNGKPADIVFISDIMARKEAEAALRASEERYRGIYENIQDVYVESSIDGTILDISPQIEALSRGQYRREDFIGKPADTFYADPRRRADFIGALKDRGIVRDFESEFLNRDGLPIYCSISARLIVDRQGQPQRIVATVRDIAERKQAQDALRESEARARLMLDTSMDAVIGMDGSGAVTEWSAGAEQIFGHGRGEALGKLLSGLIIPPVLRDTHDRGLQRFLETGQGSVIGRRIELTAMRADGSTFPVELTIAHTRRDSGHHFSAFVRDITERQQAETARAALEAQLRQSQKMEAVGTLAGGIAHDFNNIIGAILGNAALAREDLGPDHRALESIIEIDKAGRRARNLVQQILAFSRKQALSRSVIALGPVVEEAVKLLRATLPAGVQLTSDCAAGLPNVLADPTQIHQVLMNLCTNAWHAMEGQPGQIDVRLEEVTVDAALAGRHGGLRPGRYVRLSVADTGKGMDAATKERIFEPFFTTKGVDEGTGLGLAVVHGIVQGHGGAIVVESAPSKGTTFQLYFPAAD